MIDLPRTRDLPAQRHAEMRAGLERAVIRSAGRHRPVWVLPLAAAATAVVTLGALSWLGGWFGPGPGLLGTSPPSSTATQSPAVVSPLTDNPVIPGLDPDRIRQIETGCRQSAGIFDGDSVTAAPGQSADVPTHSPAARQVRLYNVVQDEAGLFALLYGADRSGVSVALSCTVGGRAIPYNSGFAGIDPTQPVGLVSVEAGGGSTGGDALGNRNIYAGQPGTESIGGRADPTVARVTWSIRGQTVEAVVANGTFAARIVHPSTWELPTTGTWVVRAYDQAGGLLTEVPGGS